MTATATAKQINYIRVLLDQNDVADGSGTRYLGAWAKSYGLNGRERQGRLDEIDKATASKLIDGLKNN